MKRRRSLTLRMRLTVLYSSLLLASGMLLLGVTYALVRHNISTGKSSTTQITRKSPGVTDLLVCKQAFGAVSPKSPAATTKQLPGGLAARCKALFTSAALAGASAQRASTLRHLVLYWVTALALLTLLSALIGWWLAGRALRPIDDITAAARRAASGDLTGRLALGGPDDELRRLATTFDEMLARLQATFESQRQFVANASHELRTPLAVIRTAIDVTMAKPTRGPEEIAAMASDIERAAVRSEALVDALLTLARSEQRAGARESVDLAVLAEDALDELTPAIRSAQLTVEHELEPAVTSGDPVLLGRMIGNLVGNAVRHNHEHGWLRVRTGSGPNGGAWMAVENSGELVPPELVSQLFEPFKRLRDRTAGDGGTGLGLSIARAVAHSHGGELAATARADGGLNIEARFPRPAA
jgi:signal transduction histidine kinase